MRKCDRMTGGLGDVEEDPFESGEKADDELDGQVEKVRHAVGYSSEQLSKKCQTIVFDVLLESNLGRMRFLASTGVVYEPGPYHSQEPE